MSKRDEMKAKGIGCAALEILREQGENQEVSLIRMVKKGSTMQYYLRLNNPRFLFRRWLNEEANRVESDDRCNFVGFWTSGAQRRRRIDDGV